MDVIVRQVSEKKSNRNFVLPEHRPLKGGDGSGQRQPQNESVKAGDGDNEADDGFLSVIE